MLKRGMIVQVNPLYKVKSAHPDVQSIILGLKVRETVGEIKEIKSMGELAYYIVDFGNEYLKSEWWWQEHELRLY